MIDFDIPADLAALREEIPAFVADQIVPYETDPQPVGHLVGLLYDGPTEVHKHAIARRLMRTP